MGRPLKSNYDYFRHDADMRNDLKVRALRARFSHTGYAVWCYMLEMLTDAEDFEYEVSELNLELLAGDFDVSPLNLREILNYCCTLGLLQRSEDECRIYSAAHKARMARQIRKRQYDREWQKSTYISDTKTQDVEDYRNENTDYRNENAPKCAQMVHSRVEKEKKETEKTTEKEASPCTPLQKENNKKNNQEKEKSPLNPPQGTEEEIFSYSDKSLETMKEEEIKDVMRKRYEALDAPGRKQYQMLNERLDEMGCKLREKFYLMSWGEWGKIGAGIWKVLANIPSSVTDKPAYMMTCMRNSINGRK